MLLLLGEACDSLLEGTGLLNHTYGVPKIQGNFANQLKEILRLEGEYARLYKELTGKVDRLLYVNKLKEIEKYGEGEVDVMYKEILEEFPLVKEDELESFLIDQNQLVKSDTLLGNYLQVILPILRSIHSSDLSSTEANILKNLQLNFDLDKGSTFQVMKGYRKQSQQDVKLQDLLLEMSSCLQAIKPKLLQFTQLNKSLESENSKYVDQKSGKLNDTDINDKATRKKYRDLLNLWNYLGKICQFLPILITTLTINWFEDESLYNIIQQCQQYLQQIDKYQAIININDLDKFATKDLLMLDFTEVQNKEISE